MSKRPTRINHVCLNNPAMLKIAQRAQLLERLNHSFQQCLPAQLSAHCKLANIKDSTVVIHTDNASYSSLIRFQAPILCQTLSRELDLDINTIEVKVRPHYHPFVNQSSNSLSLPNDAADAMDQTAEGMEDGALKTALQKLAKRRR